MVPVHAAPSHGDIVLGVDGGGTSTELVAALCEGSRIGAVVARATTGSTSPKSIGAVRAARNLAEGVSAVKAKIPCPGDREPSFSYAVFGMSGLDSPDDETALRSAIEPCGFSRDAYALCSDALLPLIASGHDEGICVVCGTGSIALGLGANGSLVRAGGWGYGVSDLGSGQWIGARALRHALRLRDDGRAPDGLSRAVLDEAGVDTLDELALRSICLPNLSATARFAKTVLTCESPEADRIASDAAQEIARLRSNAARQLAGVTACAGDPPSVPTVFAGGLFASNRFRSLVSAELAAEGCLTTPTFFEGSAAMGAAALAARLAAGTASAPPVLPTFMDGIA